MDIFNQIYTISGKKKQTAEKYRTFLEIAFNQKKIGIIPPGTDCVFAGKINKAAGNDIKMLMVLGVNEPGFPEPAKREGLLTDKDRAEIKGLGVELAADTKTQAINGQMDVYNLINIPGECIYISYSMTSNDGAVRRKSGFVRRVHDIFENLHEETATDIKPENRIFTPLSGLSVVNCSSKGNSALERWYKENKYTLYMNDAAKDILKIKFVEIAGELYGEVMEMGVTELEMYISCPYKYFARYGLDARPRKLFEISSPDVGDILHELLKHLVSGFLYDEASDYSKYIDEAEKSFSGMKVKEIFKRDKRGVYLGDRIVKRAVDAFLILKEQINAGIFSPIAYEAAFGPGKQIASPCFVIDNARVYLKGRIDRIDEAEIVNEKFFRVIDYKSSNRSLKLFRVNEGLDLQLPAYMMTYAEYSGAQAAGMYYFTADKPMIKTQYGADTDKLNDIIQSESKMEGYTLGEKEVVSAMDAHLQGASRHIPVKLKKEGAATGKVMSREEIANMMERVGQIIVENIKNIYEGKYEVHPVFVNKKSACEFCEYRNICGFDERKTNCKYRYIKEISDSEVVWGKNE